MEWEIIGAVKGETFKQRKRLFGPYPEHRKSMAEEVASGLKLMPDFRFVEVREVPPVEPPVDQSIR